MFNSFKEHTDIEFLCKVLYETLQIPVLFLTDKFEVHTRFPILGHNPIYQSSDQFHTELQLDQDEPNLPVLKTNRLLENYITIKVTEGGKEYGSFILGPCLYSKMEPDVLNGLSNDLLIRNDKETVKAYYHSLPIINKLKLLNIGVLTTYFIFSRKISVTDIVQKNSIISSEFINPLHFDLSVAQIKQRKSFKSSYNEEIAVFSYIKEGRAEALAEKLSLSEASSQLGILSKKSHLRNEKNLAIASITLATRYAMDGGLSPETAYTLSDTYIQALENISTVRGVQKLIGQALFDFASRVRKSIYQKYSKPINECISFILAGIYDEMTLEQLANHSKLSPSYLSSLFKREVGMTISSFILKEKIEESKRLLMSSNYSIAEIYTWLNFHDQGHFTRTFKRYVGTTPKKYSMAQHIVKQSDK